MSADNWGICPKCGNQESTEYKDRTLREDYELGIYKGEFYVIYSGHCKKCGFEKHFKHNEEI